jgi:hypothetical protein
MRRGFAPLGTERRFRVLDRPGVALHRRHGLCRHACRVVRGARAGQLTLFLDRAIEGDAVAARRDWAAALAAC